MKPSDKINEIASEQYKELSQKEQMMVDCNPEAELGLRLDAIMRFLDWQYEQDPIIQYAKSKEGTT